MAKDTSVIKMADVCKDKSESHCSYVIINNIPSNYHSADLRNFFSQFIETNGFECCHFRHRPEVQTQSQNDEAQPSSAQSTCINVAKRSTCCVAKVNPIKTDELIRMYNKKHWVDKKGSVMPQKCFISKIKVSDESELKEKQFQTRLEQRQIPCERQTFTKKDLISLPELHPPDVMPNGNVGTPTQVFLELIKECRLPSKVISNLKLHFSKSAAKRRYSCVSYDYGKKTVSSNLPSEPEEIFTASGHEITDVYINREEIQDEKVLKDNDDRLSPKLSSEESDDDECEEWDRHEAFHNDVTQQERSKERLYEDEIELQWEKGGSGLVFYTDAQYWDQQNGDFDEKTADDWDVDMSIYYEKGGGDKDAKDFIQMRREKQLRCGSRHESAFKSKIGKFETHTKGIGRKLLEKYGWQDGEGIGKSTIGISEALENDGQHPRDKKGFGYHGEKLNRFPIKKRPKPDGVLIGTIYDKSEDLETPESLLRSQEPFVMKYIH